MAGHGLLHVARPKVTGRPWRAPKQAAVPSAAHALVDHDFHGLPRRQVVERDRVVIRTLPGQVVQVRGAAEEPPHGARERGQGREPGQQPQVAHGPTGHRAGIHGPRDADARHVRAALAPPRPHRAQHLPPEALAAQAVGVAVGQQRGLWAQRRVQGADQREAPSRHVDHGGRAGGAAALEEGVGLLVRWQEARVGLEDDALESPGHRPELFEPLRDGADYSAREVAVRRGWRGSQLHTPEVPAAGVGKAPVHLPQADPVDPVRPHARGLIMAMAWPRWCCNHTAAKSSLRCNRDRLRQRKRSGCRGRVRALHLRVGHLRDWLNRVL
mmetsp:Transcript_96296/g.261521  ORF Transcript_96296/g.261521 Transcript_96296/m.261521 type:complete len:327 (+) Transcript_96296:767-1747(+)